MSDCKEVHDTNIVLIGWHDAKFCPALQTFDEVIGHEPDISDGNYTLTSYKGLGFMGTYHI